MASCFVAFFSGPDRKTVPMSFSSFYSLTLLSLGTRKWNQKKLQFSSQDEKYVGWTCWSSGGANLRIPFLWGTSAFHRQLQTSPQTIKNQSAAAPQTAIGLKLAQNGEFYLLFKSSVTMALAGEVSHNSLTAPPSPPHREKSLWRLVLSLDCIAEERASSMPWSQVSLPRGTIFFNFSLNFDDGQFMREIIKRKFPALAAKRHRNQRNMHGDKP